MFNPTTPNMGTFEDYLAGLVYESVSRAIRDAMLLQPQPPQEVRAVPEWGSRHDAAVIVGVSLPTIHALIGQGLVEARKVGRRTLINLSDLREKLENGTLGKYKKQPKANG